MEKEKNHNPTYGITKVIILECVENMTTLDMSQMNLKSLDQNMKFPPNLWHLNLSNNLLDDVPFAVLEIKHLKSLNLYKNRISFFDDTPNFCHNIEILNLSHNLLNGPPYWVWKESPMNLTCLDLSSNDHIFKSFFQNGYYEELLQYKTLVKHIKIFNCKIKNYRGLLSTFANAEVLEIGSPIKIGDPHFSCLSRNCMSTVPCAGIDKCCDIRKLILSNTRIYTINSDIDIYTSLVEINLSYNLINDVPKEFCNLENLEICILSHNSIMYLPDNIKKLKKLVKLYVDNNKLCMLPNDIGTLPCLKALDIYNNCIYDISEEIKQISELDLAQNYFEEPDDEEYLHKKEKIRLDKEWRDDGRKTDAESSDNEDNYSTDTSNDEEEFIRSTEEQKNKPNLAKEDSDYSDWDSDDCWIPAGHYRYPKFDYSLAWATFVKKKMDEGNFCPIDMHVISVAEQVKYEKMCNPRVQYEAEGQFDDYSSDES